VLGVNILV